MNLPAPHHFKDNTTKKALVNNGICGLHAMKVMGRGHWRTGREGWKCLFGGTGRGTEKEPVELNWA